MSRAADAATALRQWVHAGLDVFCIALVAIAIGGLHLAVTPLPAAARVTTGLILLFVLPGYAIVAALFPSSQPILGHYSKDPTSYFGLIDSGSPEDSPGLVRVTLSLVVSICAASLLGLILASTVGLSQAVLISGLVGITVVASVVAFARRVRLPLTDRYTPLSTGDSRLGSTLVPGESRLSTAVLIIAVVSLGLSVTAAGYAATVPPTGETPTEFSVLTETQNGSLTASGYPQQLTTDTQVALVVSATSHEQETTPFTVVVALERVRTAGENSGDVIERQRITTQSVTLRPGEQWQRQYEFTPQLTGEDLRLTHYLYRGEAPANPSRETAYRVTYLRVTVSEPQ